MKLTKEEFKSIKTLLKSRGINFKKGWTNFSEDVALPEATVIKFETEEDLIAVVKAIYAINQDKDPKDRILYRAVAGGRDEKYSKSFSLTPCGEADFLFELVGDEFSHVRVLDKEQGLVSVGPSIQVGPLDKTLYYDHGLMVEHSPSLIERVSRAGLMANAGHGTGLHSGGYADNAITFRFLLPNGEIAELSKTDEEGKEDPLFKELAPAHLGNLGIDLGAIMKCKPAQDYQCVKEAMSLPEFFEAVRGGLFHSEGYPLASVMYAPTYKNDLTNYDINNVIVYRWKPVPVETRDENFNPGWRAIEQWFQVGLAENLCVTDFLSQAPEIIPFYMQYVMARAGIGEGKQKIVGPAPEVYHYQVEYPHKLNDFDCLFQIGDKGEEIIDAFTKLAEKTQEQANKGEFPITYAAYARVFDGTNGGLSTSVHDQGKKVCGFDVVSSPCLPGFEELRDYMVNYLIDTYHAKLHWGKYVPDTIDYEKMYGEQMTKYKEALEAWHNKHGLKIEKNPVLNHFFCKILNMPEEMRPEPLAKMSDLCTLPTYSTKVKVDMAKAFLRLIIGDGVEAVTMRKELTRVIKKAEPKKSHWPSFFSCFDCFKGNKKAEEDVIPKMSPRSRVG